MTTPETDSDINALREEWRSWYQKILPAHAKARNWPVFLDHCMARIIYDHVAGAKWDTLWQKPAIHNLDKARLNACIRTAKALKNGTLSAEDLNRQSLIYRGK